MRSIDKPVVWAVLSLILVLGCQSLTVQANYDGNWTGLFRTGAEKPVPPNLVESTIRNAHRLGYDGQYYRYLAHDPFLQNNIGDYLDSPALRSRRILVPLVVWALAGGQQQAIDTVYILLIALSVLAGVYWTSLILVHNGRRPAWGLLFFAVPAVSVGVDTLTLDVVFAALVACFAWQVQTGSRRWLWLTVLAAPLVRETGLILVAACSLIELRDRNWRKAACWLLAGIPIILWSMHLKEVFPQISAMSHAIIPPWYRPRLQIGVVLAFITPHDYPNLAPAVGQFVQLLDRICYIGVVAAAVLGAWQLRAKWTETTLALAAYAVIVPALSIRGLWLPVYGYSRLLSPLFLLLLVVCSGKLKGWSFAAAVVFTLMVDLRVSAEMATQVLGVLRWAGLA